ncbi:MAG: class I SAM-dependent methyltransferase [Planctomycetes bacterium]|nr:class I SAM-dependent methyltransferase [Planctomycetota bacterium]
MNFDNHVDNYSSQIERAVPYVGSQHRAFVAEKGRQLKLLMKRQFGESEKCRVLDVGCGIGLMEQELQGDFDQLVGVDVASKALELARATVPNTDFVHYDGQRLPFADEDFDVAFAACVFHHVPPEHRQSLIQEMARVVARDGLVVIFEHNPLNPVTQWIVSRCEIDQDAILLGGRETVGLLSNAGLDQLTRKDILFFPWRGRFWTGAESLLSWIPMGTQYCVAGVKTGVATRSESEHLDVDVTGQDQAA